MRSKRVSPPRRRPARRISAFTAAFVTIAVVLPGGVGRAEPEPPLKDLRTQAEKLADQMEQLTEQYNGLRVRLQQAQRAARVAAGNADRQQRALQGVQDQVSGMAASRYMSSGIDPTVALATANDPQALLDQAATLNYFATQNGTKVLGLVQAMQAAQRARKAADERADEVEKLRTDLDAKRKKVAELYEKLRGRIVKRDPSALATLPVLGGGKAAQALRLAMGKLGRPYVWGAEGPNSFDCSGLVMWAYRQVGVNLPHYTGSQWNAGTHISRSQLQPGDLVFFYNDLHHVGLYIGNGKMLHAPQTGDVVKIAPIAGRPYAGAVRVA
ncbi:NlpC/P60 family protein [Actinomadura craniellae]|uniref:NlpC/P60 family protein n=1 Tax=Actinomadura craniellae TaxID=2231787 RepID=A0A365H8H6_9ACTN|nr:NlpC/P60 family protein [Actinomadura craniellae]RAY15339.1 NlpC/P60 family protein [Actinomadura craniellae]